MTETEDAFLAAVGEHEAILHKVCRIYRDMPEDRDDLFQDILHQLWRSWPSFRGDSRVSTWMYRVALSVAVARYRKKEPPIDRGPGAASAMEAVAARREESASDERALLLAAIRGLSAVEKALAALYLDDRSYREMAAIMGITENAVGVKLNRLKKKLKRQLNGKSL